ncbi:dipeptidase [Bacteroidota bacterium]
MQSIINRREFLSKSGVAMAGISLGCKFQINNQIVSEKNKGPHDFIIVEGHRDIWEFNDRFSIRKKSQNSPLKDYLLPRLIEGGIDIVIIPAGGDSVPERGGSDQLLEGSLRVVDMLLSEIDKTGGKVSIIKSKKDIPTSPLNDQVRIFLDLEGGGSIQIEPEPGYLSDRRMAMLRNFFRLGVRGMQLTHQGRNQLGDGVAEGKMAGKLSKFGVEVVEEMNRIGMMIGVSHLSANGIFHVAEISSKPIASTHTNLQKFINTARQHSDEEIKAIASTNGVIGIRYIAGETSYQLLADEIDYISELVGIEHAGVGWLGHDIGHPEVGYVPDYSPEKKFTGTEAETMYEHWEKFIGVLINRGYSEDQLAMILGGNFIRIWKEVLPD